VPATLLGFWARYLPAHGQVTWVTWLHVGLLALAVAFAVYSYCVAADTLWDGRSDYRAATVPLTPRRQSLFYPLMIGAVVGGVLGWSSHWVQTM
jgi:hypothetical protein